MELSNFIAKALGLYLVIVSIGMLINTHRIVEIVNDIDRNPSLLLLSGILPLILGTLLVVSHNVWVSHWEVIITLIGWLAFIKGITRVVFPRWARKFDVFFVKTPGVFQITALVVLILGLFLCYFGFNISFR